MYSDAGISGAKGRKDRPGLDSIMNDASRRKFDVVLVWAIDRLGRSIRAPGRARHRGPRRRWQMNGAGALGDRDKLVRQSCPGRLAHGGVISKRYYRTGGAGHIKPSGRLNLCNLVE